MVPGFSNTVIAGGGGWQELVVFIFKHSHYGKKKSIIN